MPRTVTEMIQAVRDIIDEPQAAAWDDAMLRRWINEGNKDLARHTRHMKDTTTIVSVNGTGTYDCPDNVIAIEQAYYEDVAGGRHFPLEPRHMENMDTVRGGDWVRPGTPQFFATLGFAPNLQITVFPVPTVDDDNIKLFIARLPTPFADNGDDDSDPIDTPEAWDDALADYCEFKALRRDRDPRWEEAFRIYQQKRDEMRDHPDYSAGNRELVPTPLGSFLPQWLIEFDG